MPVWEHVPLDTRTKVREALGEIISRERKEAGIESTSVYERALTAYMTATLRARFNKRATKAKESKKLLHY